MKKVFVSGCYDLLHGGHIEFFTQARALGDYLVVCFASDAVLATHKQRKSSLPMAHKKALIGALRMVDEVVTGESPELGLDFKEHFLRIRPAVLAVTDDDKYADLKKALCAETGTEYVVLPKSLSYSPISTTEIIRRIKEGV